MSVEVFWDTHAKNVIIYDFGGQWTWDEFGIGFIVEQTLITEIHHERYDSIGDFTKTSHVPVGNAIGNVYRVLRKRKEFNYGLTVVVSNNLFILTLMRTLIKLHPEFSKTFLPTETMEAARELIQHSRAASSL